MRGRVRARPGDCPRRCAGSCAAGWWRGEGSRDKGGRRLWSPCLRQSLPTPYNWGVAVERWVVSSSDPDPAILARAASVLRGGGVIVFPTDTLYGLAADARNPRAVEAVVRVKGRAPAEPLPLVAADAGQVEREAAVMSPLARRLARRFWPGPLTLVVAARTSLAPAVTAGTGTVAIRVPDHIVARRLAELAGVPLTSTSANRSGFPPAATAAEAAAGLGRGAGWRARRRRHPRRSALDHRRRARRRAAFDQGRRDRIRTGAGSVEGRGLRVTEPQACVTA